MHPDEVEPYDISLQAIEITPRDGLVLVSVTEKVLHVAGQATSLAVIAESIRHLAAGEFGPHIHEEYHFGHPFYDPRTEPLVVSLMLPPSPARER